MPPSGPLRQGPISHTYFVDQTKSLRYDASKYSIHSIRKGAAVSMTQNGIHRDQIKLLGRRHTVDIFINENSKETQRQMLSIRSALYRRSYIPGL